METTTPELFRFENTLASSLPELSVEWKAAPVPEPRLLLLNDELAAQLGLDPATLRSSEGVALLVGNRAPVGHAPVAMVYAGHQFGSYSPRLGDGRALLVGEVIDSDGRRRDLHLKGSGRTPFARGGDGKAAVGPMLREYLMGEAMHALGIPTTRALAVVATGEHIMREGMLPGAVLTRIADSHLRVGTFEFAIRLGDRDLLRRLADYSIARHYPSLADSDAPYLSFYEQVVEQQASLVAQWMLAGFVHGVMNTDNMTISGETIDYGPCAFMDVYDPKTVFSSIDHGGRYSYGNQPAIAQWNLARLGESLIPLLDDDTDAAVAAATDVLTSFPDRYRRHWQAGMRRKLGLTTVDDGDQDLFDELLGVMAERRLDYTTTFRSLTDRRDGELETWVGRWQQRLAAEGRSVSDASAEMAFANPLYVPRNHLVEEALEAATAGDLAPFEELLDIIRDPYTPKPGSDRYAEPAPEAFARHYQTFCGT